MEDEDLTEVMIKVEPIDDDVAAEPDDDSDDDSADGGGSLAQAQFCTPTLRKHETASLKCDICRESFRLANELSRHSRQAHSDMERYWCDICLKHYFNLRSYRYHLETRHSGGSDDRPCWCEACSAGRISPSSSSFSETFLCERSGCATRFPCVSALDRHALICPAPAVKAPKRVFQCSVCSRVLSSQWNLDAHFRTHSGERPFACDVCSKRFARKESCRKHQRSHAGEKPHECGKCHKRFMNAWSLRQHKLTHTRTTDKPCWCDACSAGRMSSPSSSSSGETFLCERGCTTRFACASALGRHALICPRPAVKAPKPDYKCSVCSRVWASQFQLDAHFRTHSGERPFACDVCSKRFVHKGACRKHQRSHTGEKPHECDECDKRYTNSWTLKQHKLTSHAPAHERPCFLCDQCAKSFTDRSSLKRHLVQHTGAQYVQCSVCGKCVTNLGRHMARIHQSADLTCAPCDVTFKSRQLLDRHIRHTHDRQVRIHDEPVRTHDEPVRSHDDENVDAVDKHEQDEEHVCTDKEQMRTDEEHVHTCEEQVHTGEKRMRTYNKHGRLDEHSRRCYVFTATTDACLFKECSETEVVQLRCMPPGVLFAGGDDGDWDKYIRNAQESSDSKTLPTIVNS